MKLRDEPIQLVEGCLTCPRCAGDLRLVTVIGSDMHVINIIFMCGDCCKPSAMEIAVCQEGHTHMTWAEPVELQAGDVDIGAKLAAMRRETDEKLN